MKLNETKLKNISIVTALLTSFLSSLCMMCPAVIFSLTGITIPIFLDVSNLHRYLIVLTYIAIISSLYFFLKEKQKLNCSSCDIKIIKRKNLIIWFFLIVIFFLLTFPFGAVFLILFPSCAVCPIPLTLIGITGILSYLKNFQSYLYSIIFLLIVIIFYFLYKKHNICKNCYK